MTMRNDAAMNGEATSAQSNTGPQDKPPLRLLAAEDSTTNQLVLKLFLMDMNIEIHMADDGCMAVRMYEEIIPDLVLMDIGMPAMDGLEATAHIRAFERARGLARCPIIALTANAMDGDRELCLQSDMDDYLTKPFALQSFVQMINRWRPDELSTANTVAAKLGPRPGQDISKKPPGPAPLIDVEYLENMKTGLKHSIFISLVQQYCRDAEQTLCGLERAIENHHHSQTQILLHRLKGCSANFGATAIVAFCAEYKGLEVMAKTDMGRLKHIYKATKDQLLHANGP